MGTTVLLAGLDMGFLRDGIPHPFSPHSLFEQEEREEQISPILLNETTSLCTLDFLTGALDKFRPFTGREVTVQTVSIQENNSVSQCTDFKSQFLQRFGTLQTTPTPAWLMS